MSKNPCGILMLHGFPSNPGYFLPLESPLKALELPYRIPQLRGHGAESPAALIGVTWHDWFEDAETTLEDLLVDSEKVIVIGHSMGGALALMLAANHGDKLDSIILVAAAVQLLSPFAPGKPFHFLVPVLALFMDKWDFSPKPSDCSNIHYPWAPRGAVVSNLDLYRIVRSQLSRVGSPALLIQGQKDDAIAPENMDIIYNGISTPNQLKRKIWFENTGHDPLYDCEHDMVIKSIVDYVGSRVGAMQ